MQKIGKMKPMDFAALTVKLFYTNLRIFLIKSLIDNSHPLSKHFFDNSRRYSTLFQMTSFGANELAEGYFLSTFKIQGQVHHLIGSLLPEIGNYAKFLQIYFMSESNQISIRTNMIPYSKKGLIENSFE